MAYAPNYTPENNFADDEANNAGGRSTVRTAEIDNELTAIQTSINALNDNLKLLQRSDGLLKDAIIDYRCLTDALKALIGKSAYQIAVDNGFVGDEEEWLASLVGETGPEGPPGENGISQEDVETLINQAIEASQPVYATQTFTNPDDGDILNVTDDDLITDVVINITDSVARTEGLTIYLAQSNDYTEGQTIRIHLKTNAAISDNVEIDNSLEQVLTKGTLATVDAGADITWLYQYRDGRISLLSLTL